MDTEPQTINTTQPQTMKTPPHTRCNFLTEDGRIIMGAVPQMEGLNALLNYGVSCFVNFDKNSGWYYSKLPKDIEYIEFPIAPGRAPAKKKTEILIHRILQLYNKGNIIYIHCRGGHGRAGTIAAIIIGYLKKFNLYDAIEWVISSRKTRPDTSRNFIPIPETNSQVKFISKFLNFDNTIPLPDRSDRKWLDKANKTRNNSIIKTAGINEPIRFYTNWGIPEFSNYYKHSIPIEWKNMKFKTAEHAFQASKFMYQAKTENTKFSKQYIDIIKDASTPNMARILGRQEIKGGYPWRIKLNNIIKQYRDTVTLREDWNDIRDYIMLEILMCKFKQDKHCKNILLNTGNKKIIEHTVRDSYWGNGGNDTGLNRLGELLEYVRYALRKE
jgi:ribA/ribD-fused uncharacterized protein